MGRASENFIATVSSIIDLFLDLGVQKCKSFFVAAAPISNETLAYFMSLDIRIFDIYGMSECAGPQTFNCKEYQKLGSIGRTLPGCQTKISTIGDGEEDR